MSAQATRQVVVRMDMSADDAEWLADNLNRLPDDVQRSAATR